jgi:hypothetical protein
MSSPRFLILTATEEWLSAAEIVGRLEAAGYWPSPDGTYQDHLADVEARLQYLRDSAGRPYFSSLQVLGSDGFPVLLYKQSRLIRSASPSR